MPGHPVRGHGPDPGRRAGGRFGELGLTGPARRIVLLRHGRTGHNADGRIQGQLDIRLDQTGREQAAAIADRLADLSPAVSATSDLARAAATADAVAARTGVPAVRDPRLREIDLGHWQGLTGDEARRRFPEEHAAWRRGEDVRRGGGETYAEAGARAADAIRELVADLPAGATALAVTHGGTARGALGVLLELPNAHWWRLAPLGNACWSMLVEGERGWRLERHNASAGDVFVSGAHDLGATPGDRPMTSPDVEPVK